MLELRENTDKWKYTKLLAEHNRQLEIFQQELEEKVSEQTRELRLQQKKIEKQFVQTITALSEAVDAKDHYTSGHSKRVAGRNIPEIARILGVADSYDAMASNRSYRKALPQEVVRSEIEKGKGTQFDPEIADIMLQMMDEDKQYDLRQTEVMQKRILTVDDEPENNEMFARIMQTEPSYQIFSANSGKEALEMIDRQEFDLILLDVQMPDMDGIETLRRIREKCQTAVVLTTSDRSQDMLSEVSEYRCDDYITKPYLPLLVKEIVYIITERINIKK